MRIMDFIDRTMLCELFCIQNDADTELTQLDPNVFGWWKVKRSFKKKGVDPSPKSVSCRLTKFPAVTKITSGIFNQKVILK